MGFKLILLLSFLLISNFASANNNTLALNETSHCLSAAYTAMKSFESEYKGFTTDLTSLGLKAENCNLQTLNIHLTRDGFIITSFKDGKITGAINESKKILFF